MQILSPKRAITPQNINGSEPILKLDPSLIISKLYAKPRLHQKKLKGKKVETKSEKKDFKSKKGHNSAKN